MNLIKKLFTLAAASILSASSLKAQKKMPFTPADSIKAKTVAVDTTPVKPNFPKEKKAKDTKQRNGFYTFNMGATYSSKSSLWNSGTQFNWHGNASAGPIAQIRAGFTMRNRSISYNYGFGSSYYKPNEVDVQVLLGPKIGITHPKDDDYNRAVIMPYVGVGGSYGWGQSVTPITYLSPETVEGVTIVVGKIGKIKKGKDGEDKAHSATMNVSAFAEARQQFYSNSSFSGGLAQTFASPNPGPKMRNTIRAGISLAIAF